MTKQEEIREGTKDLIGDCLIKLGCGGEGGCPHAEQTALDAQEALLNNLLQYLHSHGVVIKVGELPEIFNLAEIKCPQCGDAWFEDIDVRALKAGYVAVGPLI